MATENIPINSGTGPKVAVDLVGTDNYQAMKLMLGTDGSTAGGFWTGSVGVSALPAISGSVSLINTPVITATVSVLPAISGSVSIINTPVITATVSVLPAISGSVSVINTVAISGTLSATPLGTQDVNIVGGSVAGKQYSAGNTDAGATGTGTLVIGIQGTTARALAIHTTGGLIIAEGGAGAGVQYTHTTTGIAATGTGTLVIGVQEGATTAQRLVLTTTGGLVIGSMPAVGGGQQYIHATTTIAATGTGTLVIGVQSGATTAQRLVLSTSGEQLVGIVRTGTVNVVNVLSASGVTVANLSTGTINVVNVLSASGVTIANLTTGTVNVVNVLSASGVTIASITTGTVSVTNVLSASGVTIASIATGSVTILGTVTISGTATALPSGTQDVNIVGGSVAGKQYSAGNTDAGATGTGTLVIGIQGTTARAMAIDTTGGLIIASMPAVGGGQQYSAGNTNMGATATGSVILGVQSGATTGRALVIDTTGGLIIASMPAVGGGQQYSAGNTNMGATATGSVILGIQSGGTTGRALLVTTTGWPIVSWGERLDATNDSITIQPSYPINTTTIGATGTGVLVIGIQSGGTTARGLALSTTGGLIIASMPAVGGGQQYTVDTTNMGATATGTVIIGMQSGGTTGRAIALTTTGGVHVNVQNVVSASGVTIAAITTGTVSVVNVLSASGVTIASITTGTVSVINTVAISGTVSASLLATTAAQSFIGTAHASRWDGYAVNTTSGSSVIVKTSGAHTLYVTAMILSVDVPSRVDIFSAATTKLSVYLATKGGFTVNLPPNSPMVLNSAQSLTFTPSASGSSMLWAAGYTVT